MLWQRLLFGAILIAVLVGLLYADSRLAEWVSQDATGFRFDGAILTGTVAVLVFLGGLELTRLFGGAGFQPLILWPSIVSSLVASIPFLCKSGLTADWGLAKLSAAQLTVGALFIAIFGVFVLVSLRRKTDRAIGDMAVSIWPVLYLGLLSQFIVSIRLDGSPHGIAIVLFFIATVKICDIGAYFTGRAIGRHKLIIWLSPKKTWEGLCGGVVASMVLAVGVVKWIEGGQAVAFPPDFLTVGRAAIFGFLMAVIGQTGDLLESMIKRDAQAKDSAQAIPAFGGVLDILDSVLLTAPVAWWILIH
ncbi:hypothetical protein B7486_12255 [cyanobacterium TDX16]|nr:hypothetical protein B7486_12255 [cyanobacterium TDX16]